MVAGDADREGVEPRKDTVVSADGIVPPAGHNPSGEMASRVDTPRGQRPCRV